MIYKETWLLTGTDRQQELVKDALDKIFFPWARLNADLIKSPSRLRSSRLKNFYREDAKPRGRILQAE